LVKFATIIVVSPRKVWGSEGPKSGNKSGPERGGEAARVNGREKGGVKKLKTKKGKRSCNAMEVERNRGRRKRCDQLIEDRKRFSGGFTIRSKGQGGKKK